MVEIVSMPNRNMRCKSNKLLQIYKVSLENSYKGFVDVYLENNINAHLDMLDDHLIIKSNNVIYNKSVEHINCISDSFKESLQEILTTCRKLKNTSTYTNKCLDIHKELIFKLLENELCYVIVTPVIVNKDSFQDLLLNRLLSGHIYKVYNTKIYTLAIDIDSKKPYILYNYLIRELNLKEDLKEFNRTSLEI